MIDDFEDFNLVNVKIAIQEYEVTINYINEVIKNIIKLKKHTMHISLRYDFLIETDMILISIIQSLEKFHNIQDKISTFISDYEEMKDIMSD